MTDDCSPQTDNSLAHVQAIGQSANDAARRHVFADYMSRRAAETVRRQRAGLDLFATYLDQVGICTDGESLQTKPQAWTGITWGIIAGFVKWQLIQGYAIGSINVRLSTVKTYAGLAHKTGTITDTEYSLIRMVSGYRHKEAATIDEKRQADALPVRLPTSNGKKSAPVRLTPEIAASLKHEHPDTATGRRDAVLMTLLLDHGLRAGEMAGLIVDNVNFELGELTFYRPKVDRTQTHRLSPDALNALRAYRDAGDMPSSGPLLRNSRKGGELTTPGMTARKISKRVRYLGKQAGVEKIGPHDCRHFWATMAARSGIDVFRLQEAGGWSSLAMPRRYVENASIANDGWLWG